MGKVSQAGGVVVATGGALEPSGVTDHRLAQLFELIADLGKQMTVWKGFWIPQS